MLPDLLRPFAYLTIRHHSSAPAVVNWIAPASCVAIAGAGLVALPNPVQFFGDSGAIARTLGFLQGLPGFYIAALAAIATFGNPDMTKLMPGTPPTVSVVYNGVPTRVPLTRRRFLSSMFAYLTALSIVLTLVAVGGLAIAGPVKAAVPASMHMGLRGLFGALFFGFVAQMVSVTMWGIYYLGERVHTPDTTP